MDLTFWTNGGRLAYRIHKMLDGMNTQAFKAARDEMFHEWVAELQNAVNVLQALPAESSHERSHDETRQFERVFSNYGYEAAREAVDERRRMLAYAAAGSFNVDMSIAEVARIERKIRELDTDEILLFGEIADLNDQGIRKDYNESPSVAALITAGFFRDTIGWGCIRTPDAAITRMANGLEESCRATSMLAFRCSLPAFPQSPRPRES